MEASHRGRPPIPRRRTLCIPGGSGEALTTRADFGHSARAVPGAVEREPLRRIRCQEVAAQPLLNSIHGHDDQADQKSCGAQEGARRSAPRESGDQDQGVEGEGEETLDQDHGQSMLKLHHHLRRPQRQCGLGAVHQGQIRQGDVRVVPTPPWPRRSRSRLGLRERHLRRPIN